MANVDEKVKRFIIRQIPKGIIYRMVVRQPETDESKVEARQAKCDGCKFNVDGICRICDCVIGIKVSSRVNWNLKKRRSELTHCPKGFWIGEEEITALYQETNFSAN